jgi:hypothetical protein
MNDTNPPDKSPGDYYYTHIDKNSNCITIDSNMQPNEKVDKSEIHMKKILNFYLLIAFASITTTQSALSMHMAAKITKYGIAALCSLTELFVTSVPIINSTLFNPADIQEKRLANVQSDAPQLVTDYITNIAQERGINNIKVVLNGNAHDYCTNDNGNIIYIPTQQAQELESLINNIDRNPQEEKKLNGHTGTIHHELTHNINRSSKHVPMYEAVIGTAGAVATSATLTNVIKKHIPYINNNFALRNSFKFSRSGLTLFIAFNLMHMNMYKKYDELKADDGIPNKKELLESQAEELEARHAELLQCVDIIKENADYQTILWKKLPDNQLNRAQLFTMKTLPKSCFNNPLITDATFHLNTEHPSDLRRALRFRKRIAEFDTQ